MIRRFADPDRTDRLSLGACACPGSPHGDPADGGEGDWADIRVELGDGEERRAGVAGWQATGAEYFDWEAARDALIAIAVTRWSLLGDDGDMVPITARNASLLDGATRDAIANRIDELSSSSRGSPLPNASGGRSPSSSRATASRTRKTRTRR